MTNEEMTRLLPLVRTGDERACEQLWHGLRIPVYTVAVRILDDRYLAEDVTQEVFVRLFRTPPGEEVHSPRAWVFAVTHNTALNMLKSRRVRAAEPLSEETSPAGDTAKLTGFRGLLAEWKKNGFPENVAGVTQDTVTSYHEEILITHSSDDYTVLVLDDSTEAIDAIRAMYIDDGKVNVRFSRTATSTDGKKVTMVYSYNQLAFIANKVLDDLEVRGDTVKISDGENAQAVGVTVDVLANRVRITLYSYKGNDGKLRDAENTKKTAEFYKRKYGSDRRIVIANITNNPDNTIEIGTVPAIWSETVNPDIKATEKRFPVRAESDAYAYAVDSDRPRQRIFIVAAVIAAVLGIGAFTAARRSAVPVPVGGAAVKSGTHRRPDEKTVLAEIKAAAQTPDDRLFDKITGKKN